MIQLHAAGISDNILVARIQQANKPLDLSTQDLLRLSEAKVPDSVIQKLMSPAANPQPAFPTAFIALNAIQTVGVPGSALPAQPYLERIVGNDRTMLPPSLPTTIQTNAKGDNLASIAADDAVRNIASSAITSAATTAILSGPGIAAIPMVGLAGTALSKLPGLHRDPKITLIYALPGRQSKNILPSGIPIFEIFFGDVVGANPTDFAPVVIRVKSTDNNWRLTDAQKTNPKYLQSHEQTEISYIEDVIPSHVTNLGRGHSQIIPQDPLPAGEYGIALRPIAKTWKADLANIVASQGEGVLLMPIWDFAIGAAPNNP